ncbi:hypothetical protein MNBD_BACTEROID06-60 [hydrothermal vent metagenome]|uniref:Cytochrome c domain-containing protein n=1 Tax=hydrothermal vent metagenome TaxID=652676 RepID=A0A3B0V7N9_9ZZZZ
MSIRILFLGLTIVAFSCGTSTTENTEGLAMEVAATEETSAVATATAAIDTVSANYMLFKNQCLICHGGAPSHDKLIAPPMAAIKWRYSKQFKNKEDFVNGLVAWGLNPTEETALMKGAVKRFKVMPKPATSEDDLRIIAEFVYDNELQEPEWFAEHFKKMHGEGGKGMGMGMKKK